MTTLCPACQSELYCPCPSCRKCEPKNVKNEISHYYWEHGEIVCCPVCGHKEHVDMWLTREEERWRINA